MSDFIPLRFQKSLCPPGQPPQPDDQGTLATCTRFALSKAVCHGFDRKMWVKAKSLDMEQSAVTSILINEHKYSQGKWPTDFAGKTYLFQERNSKSYWLTTLSVKDLKTRQDIAYFEKDINSVKPVSAYILVYNCWTPLHLHYKI